MSTHKLELWNFKERYLNLKDKGWTDVRIAIEMGVSHRTLARHKRKYDLSNVYGVRKTTLCITEEQLQAGEQIGLTRRLMYQRMRLHGWQAWEACSVENMGRGKGRKKK